MEIKIVVDDSKLKEFGLGGIVDEVARSFEPQFSNIIFGRGFGGRFGRGYPFGRGRLNMGVRPNVRQVPIVKSPKIEIDEEEKIEIDEEEIKSIAEIALLNLRKDVKKILGKIEQEDLIKFILDKLDAQALGKLIQK